MSEQRLAQNVASKSRPVTVSPRPKTQFSQQQARQFLAAAQGHPLHALWTVALALGLREGEVLGLRWEDIDFESNTLTVRHSLQRVKGEGLRLVDTKTRESVRTFYMPPFIASLLKEHRLEQKQQARWGSKKWQDTGHVFTTSKGTPFHASNVYRSFKALLKESKLPDIRFHDLRGSYASFLAHHNIPVPALMNAMGHSDAKTTLTHYADVLDEDKVQVAQTAEAVFNSPAAT